MSTYVLIHGGAHGGWCWHLLAAELATRGHDVVAPDLPIGDETATLIDQAQVVVDAVGSRQECVIVAHSLGGLVGPIVASMLDDARLLVLLAAQVTAPGETCFEQWAATGYSPQLSSTDGDAVDATDTIATLEAEGAEAPVMPAEVAIASFYHDVPRALALEAVAHLRPQAATVFSEPSPLTAWPDVPTRYLLCRDDRIVPPEWSRRVADERLGVVADEIDGSHSPFLARPAELADVLEGLRAAASATR